MGNFSIADSADSEEGDHPGEDGDFPPIWETRSRVRYRSEIRALNFNETWTISR